MSSERWSRGIDLEWSTWGYGTVNSSVLPESESASSKSMRVIISCSLSQKFVCLLISGPHISLWLKSEGQIGSHDSINSWLGKKGSFEPNSCRLVQTKANFALALEGINMVNFYSYFIFKNLRLMSISNQLSSSGKVTRTF